MGTRGPDDHRFVLVSVFPDAGRSQAMMETAASQAQKAANHILGILPGYQATEAEPGSEASE